MKRSLAGGALLAMALFGCGTFSTKNLPDSVQEVRVELEILQVTESNDPDRPPYEFERLTGVIRNKKGTAIENEQIALLVNGQPLELRVSTGNYGEHHPYYQLSDSSSIAIEPDRVYRIDIRWIDGTVHEVGTVRTPNALSPDQFTAPKYLPRDSGARDPSLSAADRNVSPAPDAPESSFEVAWRDVIKSAELVVYRSFESGDSLAPTFEAGSPNDPEAIRKTIGKRLFHGAGGTLRVDPAYLAPSADKSVSAIGIEVTAAGESKVQLRGSTLRAIRRIVIGAPRAPIP